MGTPTLFELLKQVDKSRPGAMGAFAASLLASLREGPRSLTAWTLSTDQDLADRAREAVLWLQDTIIWPAANLDPDMAVADRLWLTAAAVRAEVELRRTLGASLESMLGDKTVLPQKHQPGLAEEGSPLMRVCDRAYVQLRELLHATESRYDQVLNRDRFLAEPFAGRDEELKKFLRSREFTNFMDQPEEEE